MKKLIIVFLVIICCLSLIMLLRPTPPLKTKFGFVGYTPIGFPNASVEQMSQYFQDVNKYSQIYGINAGLTESEQLAVIATRNINKPLVMVLDAEEIKSTDKVKSILKDNPNIKYLGLGNEVNLLYIEDDLKFEEYLGDYKNAYRLIKTEFSDVKIFPVFQYESLIGNGKMLGKNSSNNTNLISRFVPEIDMIGLTVYPYFDFDKPQNIPLNYFADITNYYLPIGITETSWPSEIKSFAGELDYLNTTSLEQKDYFNWISSFDKSNVEFINWLFLNDIQQNNQAFKGSGLRDTRGTEKEGFAEWKKLIQ